MKIDVLDVAKYILEELGEMTSWKLQKLVYYSQAWSLVWDEEPLFDNEIQAWANGPVVVDLYKHHKRMFKITANDVPGDSSKLKQHQLETVDQIIETYGKKSGHWLSDLTHQEKPWVVAREGIPRGERGNSVITHASLAEYYGSLGPEDNWDD